MEHKFLLSTDSSCDVPRSALKKDNIPYIPLTFTINGETFVDDFDSEAQIKEFYQKIRGGALPTTSQINPELHMTYFTELLQNGAKELVHIALSSGLSSTYQSACIAAEEVSKSHPEAKIYIVDSGGATQVQAYMLEKAKRMRDAGADAKTAAETLDALRNNLQVWVMADNLAHLKRGGRISGAAAVIGTVLNIKPIFIFNQKGGLSVVHKAKGIKKAFIYLIEKLKELGTDYKNAEICIAVADADEHLENMTKALRAAGCTGEIRSGWIGPVVGSHTGPGTLGIIFEGKPRIL